MNASSKGGAVAAVAIVLALIGWAVWTGPVDGPGAVTETAAVPAAEPTAPAAESETAVTDGEETAGTAASGEAAGAEDAGSAAGTEVTPPTIDVLRVAPDGTATLAGRAGAGAEISILVDGAEAAKATADSTGQFATVFTLAPSAAARLLSLVALLADGSTIAGVEEVAIAPMPEALPAAVPQLTAEAVPEPTAEAAPEPTADAAPEPAAEPAAPAAIKITEAGAEVLQSTAAPGLPASAVTLDVISYAADGAVQLGGTGTAGTVLRIYLDNAEIASTTVAGDGHWSLSTADIAPGIYTLRIDQLDAAGAVTSRIETPFKRETLEALAAASAAPASEAAPEADPESPATAPEASAEAAVEAAPESPATGEDAVGAAVQPNAPQSEVAEAEAPQADEGAAVVAAAEEMAPAADAAPETVEAEAAADPAPAASAAPIQITVQPGFTLWAIARDNLGAGILYVQVFEANRSQIVDPDLIYPGQVLSVPASP